MSFLWGSLLPALASDLRGKHDHLNIYPVSGIRVDGDLADWKPEMFVQMYADPDLKEFFSAQIAFAYDEQGMLVAARFTDRSPLVNHVDPNVDPFKGWSGDALQVRFITDPSLVGKPLAPDKLNSDAVAHSTLWYFTDRNEPVVDVRYGMDFHGAVTRTGAAGGLAFKKVAGGYVLEGRFPWSLLKAQPPPGQRWGLTVQPLWGDASGTLQHNFFDVISAAGFHYQRPNGWGCAYFVKPDEVAAKLAEQAADEQRIFAVATDTKPQAGIPVKYANPTKGFVSLALCKPDGQIVRTLLTKAERAGGEQTELWNGRDDDGKPVPAGEYQLKALTHPGIKPKYVCSVMNSGNPGWGSKGDHYGWGGDHGVPIGAASDPLGNTYLMWTMNEVGNFLIGMDAHGQKQWGADLSWGDFCGGATALVYDEGLLYVAKDGLGGYNWKGDTMRGGLFVYDAKTGRRGGFPNGQGTFLVTEWNKSRLDGARAAVPAAEKMQQSLFTVADLQANLVGLAASKDRLYCSLYLDNKVVALDKKTFQIAETYSVARPAGLVYDGKKRVLYAVNENSVVMVGLQTTTVTPFITKGLECPFGLALDAQGNLWVSVRGQQMQVLCFNPKGELIQSIGKLGGRPWIGKYDPDGLLMPSGISVDAREQLWVAEHDATPKRISCWDTKSRRLLREFFGSAAYAPMMAPDPEIPEHVYLCNTRFLVDYDTGSWRPDATVYRRASPLMLPGAESGYGFMGSTFEVATFQGKKFAYNGHGGVFAFGPDRFTPLFYLGDNTPGETARGIFNKPFIWTDENHDGLVSSNEVRAVAGGLENNIAQFGGAFFPGAGFIKDKRIFRPTGLTPNGVPLYPKPEEAPPILAGDGPMKAYSNWLDVWPSLQSDWQEFYAIASLPAPTGARSGGGGDCLARFDRDGNIRWRYPRVAVDFGLNAPLAKTGDLYGALRIAGQAQLSKKNGGEIVGIGCYRGYFGFVNEDGLFIDQVGYDIGRGPAPNFDVFFIENFSGYFFKHPRTGKLYLFGGDADGRILELQGWDKIQRFEAGKLTVTAAQFKETVAASGQIEGGERQEILAATPGTPSKLSKIALDETHEAQAGLGWDRTNLYALFKVPDSTPWQNAGKDWRFLFKGGDAVDIQLGVTNPIAGTKRKIQAGDVRVLIGPGDLPADKQAGKPDNFTVVAMWTKVPSGMAKEPQLYKSPTGEESFERVALLANVRCKLQRDVNSYVLEATIPWNTLGLTAPSSGAFMQGDVGVLLSDGLGMQTILRRYLFNKETVITMDIPSEVRVNCANWGSLHFE
ncbi:MAG: hypothetical protein HY360_02525 [Verrucomicrobia bacterium]|nr:hypothetical protein [Verrucomicrobiota bacterium]